MTATQKNKKKNAEISFETECVSVEISKPTRAELRLEQI